MFNKEDKDAKHFIKLRDTMVTLEFQENPFPHYPTAKSAIITASNSAQTCDIKAINPNTTSLCQSNPESKTSPLVTSSHQAGMTLHNHKQTIAPNMVAQKYEEQTQHSKQTKRVRFDLSRNKIHPFRKEKQCAYLHGYH